MKTMVEKVAKAIYQKAVDQRPLTPLGLDADWPTWDELADKDRNYALGEASAAIEAMEPTDEMIQAGVSEDQTDDVYRDVRSIFAAMIQAALKEGQ